MADSRTYFRVDNHIDENIKIENAGEAAGWLYVCSLAYCSRNMTDGRIPKAKVARLVHGKIAQRVQALLANNLWIDRGTHYEIPDYLEHQRSREQIENERRNARERAAKSRRTKPARSSGVREPEVEVDVDVDVDVITPLPPTSGGSRAEGTNPRAVAAKRAKDQILDKLNACPECGDNPNVWCARCTGLRRKLAEFAS